MTWRGSQMNGYSRALIPELHRAQARGFDGTTLARAGKKLDELAATLARGRSRRPRDKVEAEIELITGKPWVLRLGLALWLSCAQKTAQLV